MTSLLTDDVPAGSPEPPRRPRLRLAPPPRRWDDESPQAGPARADDAELPLEWVLPNGVSLVPVLPPVVVHDETWPEAGRRPPARAADDDEPPQPITPSSALPAVAPWAGRLVQACVEALSGHRPVAQLLRWTSLDVFTQLQELALPPGAGARPSYVRSVHVSRPTDGVAEVAAVVSDGRRSRAYALRLEGRDGRWRCTELVLG